jgi:hypothetical protein
VLKFLRNLPPNLVVFNFDRQFFAEADPNVASPEVGHGHAQVSIKLCGKPHVVFRIRSNDNGACAGMLSRRGLGLVVQFSLGYVAE